MTKYMQVANIIREKILSGEYKSNEQIPFEKDLCEIYGISKMTAKKAMDILIMEGLIVKKRGSGTFVKNVKMGDMQKALATYQFQGFTASHKEGAVSSIVLEFVLENPTAEVADVFNIEEDDFVYKIIRIRQLNGVPNAIEEMYMPINVISGLKKKNAEKSIYEYIEKELGLNIQSSHRTLTARPCTDFEGKHLNLETGEPVVVSVQTAFLDNGVAFEFSKCVHSHKTFKFETVLIR